MRLNYLAPKQIGKSYDHGIFRIRGRSNAFIDKDWEEQ